MELDRIMIVCLKCGEEYKLTASLKTQTLKKLKIDLKEYSKLEIEKKIRGGKKLHLNLSTNLNLVIINQC